MKKNILRSSLFSIFCVALLTVTSATESLGQGGNASRFSKRDVSTVISTLEQSSNVFRQDFDQYLDQSNLNGTREEDRLNRIVQSYDGSMNRLRGNFDSSDNWWQSRSNVQAVMSDARQVNTMMNTLPFARRLERQWNQMRRDINRLAETYDLPDLAGRGGNSGGGGNNGGGSVPDWAVGTFYGQNPQDGSTITLTTNRNGRVIADLGNRRVTGTLDGRNLYIDGATARFTRIDNGLRAVRSDNGLTIDYFRTGGGNSGGGGNVPNWAVGRFYSTVQQNGRRIELNIQNNGRVFVDFGDGSTSNGTIYGTTLTIDNATATLRRSGNGISAVRTDNGLRIDYTRTAGGNSGGNGDIGGQMGEVPNWAIGTFVNVNPRERGAIAISIDRSGRATVDLEGRIVYGTVYRSRLTLNGVTAELSRLPNGLRGRNLTTGEIIDYVRR